MKPGGIGMQQNSIISKGEYQAISHELQQLKARKKDLALKLNNEDLDFIRGFELVDRWLAWREQANHELEKVNARISYLHELARVYLGGARINNAAQPVQRREWRRQFTSSTSGIMGLLIAARIAIEELSGDDSENWKDEHRAVCANLHTLEKSIRGDTSFGAWLSPDEARLLREKHDAATEQLKAMHRQEVISIRQTISSLQSQLASERATKGRAAAVLRRLRDLMFVETEDWRLRRGYTHRISITRDMCDEINEAL